jgi:predicted RNA binding protein YcfA (HicA-like mRNA interferase family)
LPKKYPPLIPREVEAILRKLGFVHDHNLGDHHVWKLGNREVQVDQGKEAKRGFATPGMKIIVAKSGLENDHESFYRATRRSAKKIGKPVLSDKQIANIRKKLTT